MEFVYVCRNKHLEWALLKFIFFFSFALLPLFIVYPILNIRYLSVLPKTRVVNVKMLCAYVCIYSHKCVNKRTLQKEFKVMLQKSSFISFNKLQMHFSFSFVSWVTFWIIHFNVIQCDTALADEVCTILSC